jgi:hypothetical protein
MAILPIVPNTDNTETFGTSARRWADIFGVDIHTSNIRDSNANEALIIAATSSAINEFTITNAAAGNNPTISASGGDTNISMTLTPKGTGSLRITGDVNIVPATAGSDATLTVLAPTGQDAELNLTSNNDADDEDAWQIKADNTNNDLNFGHWNGSAYENAVFISSNFSTAADTILYIRGAEAKDAQLVFQADQGDDDADNMRISVDDGGQFNIDTFTTGSWVNTWNLVPGTGKVTQNGDLAIVGGDIVGASSLELIKLTETGSAVNEITIANAATGNSPTISATGDNTNIGINLEPKGTGALNLTAPDATDPALFEMFANNGGADGDKFRLRVTRAGLNVGMAIDNFSTGSWVQGAAFNTSGDLDVLRHFDMAGTMTVTSTTGSPVVVTGESVSSGAVVSAQSSSALFTGDILLLGALNASSTGNLIHGQNDGTGDTAFFDVNGNAKVIAIDSAATSKVQIEVLADSLLTSSALNISVDAATTASAIIATSSSANFASSNGLVFAQLSNAAAASPLYAGINAGTSDGIKITNSLSGTDTLIGNFINTAEDGRVRITGGEAKAATLELYADDGDDNADKLRIQATTTGTINFDSFTSGAWVNKFQIQPDGDATLTGNFIVPTTKGVLLTGTATGSLPGAPTNGTIFHDSSTNKLVVWLNGAYETITSA